METVFLLCAIIGGTIMLLQFAMTLMGLGAHHGTGDLGGGGGFDVGHDVGMSHDFSGGHGHLSGADSHAAGSDHFSAHGSSTGHDAPTTGHNQHSNQNQDANDEQQQNGSSWLFKVVTIQTLIAAVAFFGIGGKAALAADLQPSTALIIAVVLAVLAMHGVYYLARTLHRFNADGTLRLGRAIGQSGTVYLPIPGDNAGAGKIHLNLQNRTVELQAMTASARLASGAKVRVIGLLGPDTVAVEPLIESEVASHA